MSRSRAVARLRRDAADNNTREGEIDDGRGPIGGFGQSVNKSVNRTSSIVNLRASRHRAAARRPQPSQPPLVLWLMRPPRITASAFVTVRPGPLFRVTLSLSASKVPLSPAAGNRHAANSRGNSTRHGDDRLSRFGRPAASPDRSRYLDANVATEHEVSCAGSCADDDAATGRNGHQTRAAMHQARRTRSLILLRVARERQEEKRYSHFLR